jgi:hypothetical protein
MVIPTDNCPLACPAKTACGIRKAIKQIANFSMHRRMVAMAFPILEKLFLLRNIFRTQNQRAALNQADTASWV